MILWFVSMPTLLVAVLFRDPRIDYRLVVVGAIAPNLLDAPEGGPRYAHTLLASAAVLAGVVLGTRGRADARRRWLALPMGMLVHFVLEGGWTHPETFWWPALGRPSPDAALFPTAGALLVEEVAGAVGVVWIWHRAALGDRDRRRTLIRSGRLELAA